MRLVLTMGAKPPGVDRLKHLPTVIAFDNGQSSHSPYRRVQMSSSMTAPYPASGCRLNVADMLTSAEARGPASTGQSLAYFQRTHALASIWRISAIGTTGPFADGLLDRLPNVLYVTVKDLGGDLDPRKGALVPRPRATLSRHRDGCIP